MVRSRTRCSSRIALNASTCHQDQKSGSWRLPKACPPPSALGGIRGSAAATSSRIRRNRPVASRKASDSRFSPRGQSRQPTPRRRLRQSCLASLRPGKRRPSTQIPRRRQLHRPVAAWKAKWPLSPLRSRPERHNRRVSRRESVCPKPRVPRRCGCSAASGFSPLPALCDACGPAGPDQKTNAMGWRALAAACRGLATPSAEAS